MFGLLIPNGGNTSHPTAPTAQNRWAKIPSPQPPSFLPACWKPLAIFSDGGGTSIWMAGRISNFSNF
ncbi:MAG: hypothetical protein COZ85_02910 [Candidatus Moranbacteria bacterium CG_4_8_14_3_um_filter_34_16]|nr:MAG: hypothetical protein COZ85_02910 [Candidatus Moranbacteria bacterium CG_4_8_14_3_um_filter_34_16]PJA89213.1 MAG: hypothetical protein CO138_01605 [Candidatus Moranbacteria bacterium CG_4_9_14_3_um_filter_33_15]